jgi:hypothetical protein
VILRCVCTVDLFRVFSLLTLILYFVLSLFGGLYFAAFKWLAVFPCVIFHSLKLL